MERRAMQDGTVAPARMPWRLLAVAASALALAACGSAASTTSTTSPPATTAATAASGTTAATTPIENCGVRVAPARPPARAVTLNQGATEVMLALGLQDRMIGTAYLDDRVAPAYAAAYRAVPVLAEEYPSREVLLSKDPDFVYASYASAFAADAAGPRDALAALGIRSYVSPFGCEPSERPAKVTLEGVFTEIADIGTLFGVRDRAQALIAAQRAELARALAPGRPGRGLKVLWWDSETKAPFVGTCCGAPAMMLEAVGARNVFAGVQGSWANVSWERAVAADPDVIVLVDASWDTAAAKLRYARASSALRGLRAVREHRVVELPFSDTTPGVRVATGIGLLADGLRRLAAAPAP
jgi:iron complex transport system substrate-binding protein